MMQKAKWFFHPIFVFIFSILALGTSLFLYIYWYMKVNTRLIALARTFDIDPGQVFSAEAWVVILVLSVLVAIILIGIFTIFVYNQKTFQLYRLQNNFIDNFTHELKTPVTSLKLYLETFLKHDIPREDQEKYIHYMLQDVNRLSDNINRILDISRIEGRRYHEKFVEADLVQVTEKFYAENRHLFQNCVVRIHNTSNAPVLHSVNIPLFEMLLMNILTNAIKYNRSDVPCVEITFKRKSKQLWVQFQDNGIGIEKKELKKIFRKFYQIGRSENMTAKGSGLGLYLVYSIARIHKGKIAAQSMGRNQGTLFTLTLPCKG
jgi:signal transduction histidine kinase